MTHCSDFELAGLLADEAPDTATALHVRECAICRERLDALTFDAMLDDEETWLLADELSGLDERLNRNADDARRTAEEDAEAAERLAPYLRKPYRFAWTNFLRTRQYQTAGVVRILCRAANERCFERPREARILAENAVAIAEALPRDHYLGDGLHLLRGLAWKERGNAFHAIGDFAAALDSFDHALRAYGRVSTAYLDRAIVNYCRARTLSQSEKFDEAMALLGQAEAVYVSLGDTARYIVCRLEVGNTQWRQGDTLAAIETWIAIRGHAEADDNLFLAASIANNLGFAYLRLERFPEAGSEFHRALSSLVELGKEAATVRPEWGLAVLLVASGDARRGADALRRCLGECEKHGMTEDKMLVSLDLADALLVLGEEAEAHRLCKRLVRDFKRAGLRNSALRAFDFLRQASLEMTLTRQKISYVRSFIDRLASNPGLRFVAPSPSAA